MRTGEEKAPCPFTQPPVSPPEDLIEPNLPGEPVLMRERNENPQGNPAKEEEVLLKYKWAFVEFYQALKGQMPGDV